MTSQFKNYRDFNTSSFEGAIHNVSFETGQYGEYAAITVITYCEDEDGGNSITFNNSNGLLALAKKGFLPKGRRVIVTGSISKIAQVYEKDGQVRLLKRPRIKLDSKTVQLTLGKMPGQDTPQPNVTGTVVVQRVSTDPTPAFGEATPVEDGVPIF